MAQMKVMVKSNVGEIRKEGKAVEAILPGQFLELTSAGVKLQSNAGDDAALYIAVENSNMGKKITDAYAIADQVQYNVATRGQVVYGQATGTFAIGTYCELNAVGAVIPLSSGVSKLIALEAQASGTNFINMEVI